jgi:hypothetical protein
MAEIGLDLARGPPEALDRSGRRDRRRGQQEVPEECAGHHFLSRPTSSSARPGATFFGNVEAAGGDDVRARWRRGDQLPTGPGDDKFEGGAGMDFLPGGFDDDLLQDRPGDDTLGGDLPGFEPDPEANSDTCAGASGASTPPVKADGWPWRTKRPRASGVVTGRDAGSSVARRR